MNIFTIASAIIIIASSSKGITKYYTESTHSNPPSTVNKTTMLQLINEVRSKGYKCGNTYYPPVPALSWNEQLEQAAYNHTNDMYTKKYFAHLAPDGSNAGVRIERTGYKWMTYGENIATGYVNEKEVVEGWLQSQGHCKNIMSRNFKEFGVARIGKLWTQAFARSMK